MYHNRWFVCFFLSFLFLFYEGLFLHVGLNRCRKSCRLRWLNYLRPNIKRGNFAEDEVDLLIRLHKLLGNRQVYQQIYVTLQLLTQNICNSPTTHPKLGLSIPNRDPMNPFDPEPPKPKPDRPKERGGRQQEFYNRSWRVGWRVSFSKNRATWSDWLSPWNGRSTQILQKHSSFYSDPLKILWFLVKISSFLLRSGYILVGSA